MKKIAVLTLFHNSTNYGGNLQAYALCQALNQQGFQAEQLRIDCYEDCYALQTMSRAKFAILKAVKRPAKAVLSRFFPGYRRKKATQQQLRQPLLDAFRHFNYDLTPHSGRVYTSATIGKAADLYDGFVTGSDQVWNPRWYSAPFFLTFVKHKPKVAYAASIAQASLPQWIRALYRKHLRDFTAVSVRETAAVQLLEGIAPEEAEFVLDPTLLLTRQDWDKVCTPRQVAEPYAFCYFLGDDPAMRQTAAAYAQAHGLTLVTIPNATGLVHKNDKNFGDLQLATPSPEEFISLIRHADQVFTDSFHASVFSLIYERQFCVFARAGHKAMGSRLDSLTALFHVEERHCDTPERTCLSYVESLSPIDYSRPVPGLEEARRASLTFLTSHLE